MARARLTALAACSVVAAAGAPTGAPAAGHPLTRSAAERQPKVRLFAPSYASDHSLERRFTVRWTQAKGSSHLIRYRLEARRDTNVAGRWRTVPGSATRTRARFRGRAGVAYLFRVRGRDRPGVLSEYAYSKTVVPHDDRSPRVRLSPGWRSAERRAAYGRTLSRGRRAGLTLRMRFTGTRVALIARRHPRAARLLVKVDDRARIVSLRGRNRFRRVIFRSRRLGPRPHRLTARTLGAGSIDLDAIAIDTGPGPPTR